MDRWIAIQRSHAIENHLPVFVTNRVGIEQSENLQAPPLELWRNSFICNIGGEVLGRSDDQHNGYINSVINLGETAHQEHTWSFLRDRGISHYRGLPRLTNKP